MLLKLGFYKQQVTMVTKKYESRASTKSHPQKIKNMKDEKCKPYQNKSSVATLKGQSNQPRTRN